jgi:Ca-activated chloride channel family protein
MSPHGHRNRTGSLARLAAAALLLLAGWAAAACAGDGETATLPHGSAGVGQVGAQDFGLFRRILEAGEVPAPQTIDAVGFFAEHKLDYPPADCGADLCLHGLFGAGPNLLTGSRMAVVQIGINTPIDPEDLERPPLNLVIAIDTSGSMTGQPLERLVDGLTAMLDVLAPADRLSLVTYADRAHVRFEALGAADRETIAAALAALGAAGRTNVHDGLATAFRLAAAHRAEGAQNRVLLLSDGVANVGIVSRERMVALAAAYAREGIGLTTVGVGGEFDVGLMRALGEVGAGSFYFLEDAAAVREVFVEEARSFLYPLALDALVEVQVAPGWRIHDVYGTNGWRGGSTLGRIELPMLFVAGRTSAAAPVDGGRRGGGGAILVELAPEGAVEATGAVGTLTLSWTDPRSGQRHTRAVAVAGPGRALPPEGWFLSETVAKGFAMLYVYRGLHIAAEQAAAGDVPAARGVLEAVEDRVAAWLHDHPDPDLEDDLRWLARFREILEAIDAATPVLAPPEPAWYTCG